MLEVSAAKTRRGRPVDCRPLPMQPMQLWFILEVSLADIGSVISQLPDTRGVFGQYCRFLWLIPDVSVADTVSTCFRYWRYPGQIQEVSVFDTRGVCG